MKLLAIIGSAKSGTTALARHLGARPDMVLGTQKEPRYFTDFAERTWTGPAAERFQASICTSWEAYRANFKGLEPDTWAIDSSTDYLWNHAAPDKLLRFAQENTLRLICVTRDPVDRAVSEYNHTLRQSWEKLSMRQSLDAEAERMAMGWQPLFYHRRRSTISADLQRYHDLMEDRLLVVDHAELVDPEPLLRRISCFLDIPHHPADQIARENQSFLPRNAMASAALKNPRLRRIGRLVLPEALRNRIRAGLRTDARNLKTVGPEDIDRLRNDLAEETQRCLVSPLIPTDTWKTALPVHA